jgi:hypothetical protein
LALCTLMKATNSGMRCQKSGFGLPVSFDRFAIGHYG